jgi:hypothetical protein
VDCALDQDTYGAFAASGDSATKDFKIVMLVKRPGTEQGEALFERLSTR